MFYVGRASFKIVFVFESYIISENRIKTNRAVNKNYIFEFSYDYNNNNDLKMLKKYI